MNYEKIGEFIKKQRKEKNLTQKELALKLNVTDKAVSKWENGLGCPDVSILELLSKELGVSILEILKGRIIQNEVIPVTEANDYVKETINYSKINTENKIKNILTFIILFFSILIIFLNVVNIININTPQIYQYDSNIKSYINKIEDNVNNLNDKNYSKEDYEIIKSNLLESVNCLKKLKLLTYNQNDKIYLRNLYEIDGTSFGFIYFITTLRCLEKYDLSLIDYEKDFLSEFKLLVSIEQDSNFKIFEMYKYEANLNNNILRDNYINTRMAKIEWMVKKILFLSNKAIEVGDRNE